MFYLWKQLEVNMTMLIVIHLLFLHGGESLLYILGNTSYITGNIELVFSWKIGWATSFGDILLFSIIVTYLPTW